MPYRTGFATGLKDARVVIDRAGGAHQPRWRIVEKASGAGATGEATIRLSGENPLEKERSSRACARGS